MLHTFGTESYVVIIFGRSPCLCMYWAISFVLSPSPYIGSRTGLPLSFSGNCAALLRISSTNGAAISVGVFCIVARVVAPHPVVPLLSMQFSGIFSIQSPRYCASSGAVIFVSFELVVSGISVVPVAFKVIFTFSIYAVKICFGY